MGSRLGLAIRDVARALAARRSREEDLEEASDEAGFTLIELMVVLLIMGILMAIAIPTFLGAASGAHDKASQSDLTNSMTSAKSIYASTSSYTGSATAKTALTSAEPELNFTTGSSTKPTMISVSIGPTSNKNVLLLASFTTSTTNCWVGVDNETTGNVTTNGHAAPPGISYGLAKKPATGCTASTTVTGWHRAYPKS